MSADPSQMPPAAKLRADARHNRTRILAAAREVFAARGLDVPMAAIARRAGVGVATLYRRFPTRTVLITEVFTDQLTGCVSVVDTALGEPDPWRGFCVAVETVCRMQMADRGFTGAFLTAFPEAVDFERARGNAERGLRELIRRAQAAGRLRADFTMADLMLLFMANGGVAAELADQPATAATAASRRLVAAMLTAWRTERAASADPLPPAPPLTLHHI
ncbi:helix-turn-helix domain-containing protein [Actinoallomurus sp. NPDC050550]|uniref:TetR/AcrR family transcriptional regulator n=1 Tax=Actinoallomurus sp. NPDC050550 TaxID=3154937 RepID=UPI0033E33B63